MPALRSLSRTDLLELPPRAGIPPRAENARHWEARRREAVAGFLSITGLLPRGKRCELAPKLEEEVDCGSYVRRRISYESTPGGRVPAFLCVPKAALAGKAVPAVLCLHPTDNVVGNGVVVGLGGKPNRQYASELAERGFVTLAPGYPLLAEYQPDLAALGFESGTAKAVWDNIRGLDFLQSLPFVQKERGFAAVGHSLGGHNSIFTAVLDARIRVIVSSCGFDSFLDYMKGNLKGWTQQRYMPELEKYLGRPGEVPFDFYELIAALAPRHVLINAPLGDSNFRHDSVDRIVRAARPVFELFGAGDNLMVLHPDCAHDFPDAARTTAYELISAVLGAP